MQDPVQRLYDAMRERNWNEVRNFKNPPKRFRASEADDCQLKIFFRLAGYRPAPASITLDLYGEGGDIDHDWMRLLLEKHGISIGGIRINEDHSVDELINVVKTYEVETKSGAVPLAVSVRADGLIDTPHSDKPAILEIKGCGYWAYRYLQEAFEKGGNDAVVERVKEKHTRWYKQCQVMMGVLGEELVCLIPKSRDSEAIGLYNEITGERSAIYIKFDTETWEDTLQKFAMIAERLADGDPPPPGKLAGSYDCNGCPFLYRCHNAKEKGEIDYPGPKLDQ